MTEHQKTVRDLMADGIATAVGYDGDIPIRWVAVVETLDEQGARCMWRMCPEGMAQWDAMSLHEYAMTKIRGELLRDELKGQ